MNRIFSGLMASMGFILIAILGAGLLWLNNYGPALFFDADKKLFFVWEFWQIAAWSLIGIGAVGTSALTLVRCAVFAPAMVHKK